MLWLWRPLLAMTVHEELARVEAVDVAAVRLGFMVLIALVLAVAVKIVGILLITGSDGHTSELQSRMRISYAVFCLQRKKCIDYRMVQPDAVIEFIVDELELCLPHGI